MTDTHHAPKRSRIILLSAAALAGLIGWASFADIDQISRAPGQVIPAGRVQIVQSNDGGIIQEIRAREGDSVRKGDVLVVLDRVRMQAAVDEARAQVAGLQSQKSRIEAELFNRPLAFPVIVNDFPEFAANERELYARRRAAHTQDIASLKRMLGLVRSELNMNRPLLANGDVSRAEVLRLERSVADIESQITSQENKYLADLQTQYSDIDQKLASASQILKQRESSLQQTVLTAPVNGVIKNVRLTTIGGVLRPGDEVLELVPTGENLIVEARVSPRDIAYVRKGQIANVRFDAYDSSIFGTAKGKVTYVSPDTISERRETGGGPDQIYYRVHISADTSTMHGRADERIAIQPGMTATAEIVTGHNTVMNFILKPISKTLSGSFGER